MVDPSIQKVKDTHEFMNAKEMAFGFYILWICAHAHAMR